MEIVFVLLAVFGVFAFLLLIMYNGLVRLKNEVQNSWSGIDVQLKRRADLIPNLVSAVKGYMKHEREALETVTKARVAIMHSEGNVKQAAAAENVMESALKNLFAVAENYPKLQASENFLTLQNELASTEDEVAASRRIYNDNVRMFNTKIEIVPNNVVAMMFGFRKFDYFRASKKDKENIEVEF